MTTATPATTEQFRLGEGPVWDAPRSRLLWVDIEGRAVLQGLLDAGAITVTDRISFDTMVGAVAAASDGTLLVAAQEQLVVRRPDGSWEDGPRVVPAGEVRRLNDGGTDPAGRFLVGTLSLEGPSEREVLVRLEADGRLTVLDDDLALSNGLAWSSDGRRMFSVDTLRRMVSVRDYDPASGAVGARRVHLRLDDGLRTGSPWTPPTTCGWPSGAGERCGATPPTGPWSTGSRPAPPTPPASPSPAMIFAPWSSPPRPRS